MKLMKRAGWQFLLSVFTLFLHLIMVLVTALVLVLSPLAEVALYVRRRQPQRPPPIVRRVPDRGGCVHCGLVPCICPKGEDGL